MALNQNDVQNLSTFVLSQLLGININSAKSYHTFDEKSAIQPNSVFNLRRIHKRGLTPIGSTRDTLLDLDYDFDNIIGLDQFGIVSIDYGDNKYRIFNSVDIVDVQTKAAYASLEDSVHIPNVGAYRNKDQFLIYDKDGVVVEPFSYALSYSQSARPEPVVYNTGIGLATTIIYDNTYWIVGGQNGSYAYSNDDGITWTTATVASTSENINSMAYDGALYVAVGTAGKVWVTDDIVSGTWTEYTLIDSGTLTAPELKDVLNNGTLWFIVGDTNYIATAPLETDPTSFSVTQENPYGADDFSAIGYDESTNEVIITVDSAYSGINRASFRATLDNYGTVDVQNTWQQAKYYGAKSDSNGTWLFVGGRDDPYVSVIRSTDGVTYDALVTPFQDNSTDWKAYGVNYFDGTWIICGSADHVYYSTDGNVFNRIDTGVGAATVWNDIAFNENGFAFLVSDSGYVLGVDYSAGLETGKAEIYQVPYIQTKSGKLVLDVSKKLFYFSSSKNRVLITAPAKPVGQETAQLFVDVYVRFAKRSIVDSAVVDEELDDKSIIYLATLDPEEEYTFNELPSLTAGVLGLNGAIGICAYRNFTELYLGRLYGVPSEDADNYKFIDPDIKLLDVISPYSVTYTEQGYLNLFTVNNSIPLEVNNSDDLNAGVVGPQGLFVFADNEAFIISGDVANDTIKTNKYPDTLGCDKDALITSLGGYVFTIWNGDVIVVSEGRAPSVSHEVFNPSDPFIQVAAYPSLKMIVALTESGISYQYELNDASDEAGTGAWFDSLISPCRFLLQSVDEVYFVEDTEGNVLAYDLDATPDTPEIYYKDWDFGNPYRLDKTYSIMFQLENFNQDNDNKVRLYYSTGILPDVYSPSAKYVDAVQVGNIYYFKIKNTIRGALWDFRIVLNEFPKGAIVDPDWEFKIIQGSRVRALV